MSNNLYRFLAFLWLLIILCAAGYSVPALLTKDKIQFDILALLPAGKTEKMQEVSTFLVDSRLSNRMVFLLGSPDASISKSALLYFTQEIIRRHLPMREEDPSTIGQAYKQLFTDLYPYRAGLLAKTDRTYLANAQGEVLMKRALAEAISPFGTFRSGQLKSDPFSLYPHFVTSLYTPFAIQRDADGNLFVISEGITWYLFQGMLTDSAFSLKLQKELTHTLTEIFNAPQMAADVQILKTGALFYAAKGAEQAEHEISRIGLISVIGIILLMLWVFRTVRPILFALTVVFTGLMGGLAVCLYMFGSVHVLALVFGCSLIGVAVDYALYFFCASYLPFKTRNSSTVLSALMPALPLAVLASSLGYFLLMVVPFPGVQQMAVLAGVGLVCTFIGVCVWGNYFVKLNTDKIFLRMQATQDKIEKLVSLGSIKSVRSVWMLLLLVVGVVGMNSLKFDDTVRHFQAMDAGLIAQENQIKSMMKFDQSSRFIAVTGSNIEEILETEERITSDLDHEHIHYRAISQLLPSESRQRESRALLERELYQKYDTPFMKALGFEGKLVSKAAVGLDAPFFNTMNMLMKLPTGWRELVHHNSNDTITSRIFLTDVVEQARIESILSQYPGSAFIDPVKEYSGLFATYRKTVSWLVLGVLLGIIVLLSIRMPLYRAINIILPVALSLFATIGIIGLFEYFTLFHVMGLMLVVCIGIDYALFLYWRNAQSGKDFRLLGNSLAATTTLLSFGLLMLSQTEAVHQFGLAVFLGIVICLFTTTLICGKTKWIINTTQMC